MTLKDHSLAPAKANERPDPLDGLDQEELYALRQRIDLALKIDISKLNLADELGLQYQRATNLLAIIQEDKLTPANQKAQVFNSISTTLKEIVKQSGVVFDAERLKRYERAMIRSLEDLPEESKRKFFDLYGEYLTDDQVQAPA